MKLFSVIFLAITLCATQSFAKGASGGYKSSYKASSPVVSTRGYTNKNGTYVSSYKKTSPDGSKMNNYSTKGNVNPYTGKVGRKNP